MRTPSILLHDAERDTSWTTSCERLATFEMSRRSGDGPKLRRLA